MIVAAMCGPLVWLLHSLLLVRAVRAPLLARASPSRLLKQLNSHRTQLLTTDDPLTFVASLQLHPIPHTRYDY